MSDEESSDSEFDPEDVIRELEGMQHLLRRHFGKYKDVAHAHDPVKQWPELNSTQVLSLEGENANQTIRMINEAEDSEKKRRMSVPFTDSLADDTDLRETSDHVTSMHEELLHLFAIHDAKFQEECEKERRVMEVAKERMQEELLRKASLRRTHQAYEEERQRRIQEMETLFSKDSEESMAMADTNARLSLVHQDLINAFRVMERAVEKKEHDQHLLAEENKEMVLQEIRRRSTKKKHKEEFELTKQQKLEEYNARKTIRGLDDVDKTLVQVQEDLLRIFGKLKKEKMIKKETIMLDQSNRKELMHEELLHKTLGKKVSKLEAEEKARRIKEANSCVNDEDRKRQKAIDMLIQVQQQLLEVMSSCQSSSEKVHSTTDKDRKAIRGKSRF